MAQVFRQFAESVQAGIRGWDRFWFTPVSPRLLGFMRILVGVMLVYSHGVWTLALQTFFSEDGVLPKEYSRLLYADGHGLWTHFDWIHGPWAMGVTHGIAITVMVLFTIGLWTRWTAILSFLFLVSYAHRATGALFGLDQILGFLTLYLAVGPSGAAFSIDRWRKARRGESSPERPRVMANIAIRLMQVHLCVVYWFAGMAKLQGTSWWNGEAIWGALASADYQTWDLTWLAHSMWLINLITLGSIIWETSYAFLIWNRYTRPFYLAMAVFVHLGIGLFMGMLTFGMIMIIANVAFLRPDIFSREWRGGESLMALHKKSETRNPKLETISKSEIP